MDWNPGDNEAAAAAEAMRDIYGDMRIASDLDRSIGPPDGFSVGERVTYRSAKGDEEARGIVVEVLDELAGSYHIKIRVPGHGTAHRFASESELAYF